MPVGGDAPWLGDALSGILRQQPAPDLVIVVDDGARVPLVLPPPGADDGRVHVVRREQPGGPAAARQTGLDGVGDCELVAFCDADDVWTDGKLAAQLAALARHRDAALCFGRAQVVDASDRVTGERWVEPPAGLRAGAQIAPQLYEHNPIPTSSVLARTESLRAAGGFDARYSPAEDWELWLRLAAAGRAFVCEPAAVVRYRRHAGGLTADVQALARALLALHETHCALVDEETRRRVHARDLEALASGLVRDRRWREARAALREAGPGGAGAARRRLRAAALAVPGLRSAMGRRDPYAREPAAGA